MNLLAGCNLGDIYDDDEKIAKPTSNYIASNWHTEIRGSNVSANAKKFSGAYKLADIEVKNSVVVLTYSCTVTEGRFKVVAVKDGEVHVIFEGEGTVAGQSIDLSNGKYRLKMVGDHADFEMNLTIVGAQLL